MRIAGRGYFATFNIQRTTDSEEPKTYVLTIQARDAAGNTVTASGGSVIVDRKRATAREITLHQNEERRQYLALTRRLRAEYRRPATIRAKVNRFLSSVLRQLRAHWAAERRQRLILPFVFPEFVP